jgi:hypothetical protein
VESPPRATVGEPKAKEGERERSGSSSSLFLAALSASLAKRSGRGASTATGVGVAPLSYPSAGKSIKIRKCSSAEVVLGSPFARTEPPPSRITGSRLGRSRIMRMMRLTCERRNLYSCFNLFLQSPSVARMNATTQSRTHSAPLIPTREPARAMKVF